MSDEILKNTNEESRNEKIRNIYYALKNLCNQNISLYTIFQCVYLLAPYEEKLKIAKKMKKINKYLS